MSNCNCKSQLEAKLLERFIKAEPDAERHAVELVGYAIGLTANTLVLRPSMPIRLSSVRTSRAGVKRPHTIEQTMVFSFCPFCGIKLGQSQPKEAVARSAGMPA